MITGIAIIIIVFVLHYKRKKREEKWFEEFSYKPEENRPYPRGYGEIMVDLEWALFDQFVRQTWPNNFLSWECKLGRLTHAYVGTHLIEVKHTDGTYHEEAIKVEHGEPLKEGEHGAAFKFTVVTYGEPNDDPKNDQKPKPNPKPKKPEPKKPEPEPKPNDKPPKTPFEIAKEWVENHKEWIAKKLDTEKVAIVPYGDGEDEIPEDLADELFNVIDNHTSYQVQRKESQIEIYPDDEE